MKKILQPGIEKNNYSFDDQGLFKVPPTKGYQAAIQFIQKYPADDSPDVFGLHVNAQMSSQSTVSRDFLNALQVIQPSVSGGSGGSQSDHLIIETAERMHNECPPDLVYHEPEVETSLQTVLRQEIIRFNKLLRVVRESTQNLVDAINGLIVMSDSLSEMYVAFINGKLPLLWSNASYPTMKPLVSWFADMKERVEFIRNWSVKGEPTAFWFGGFFFPQSFMTGVLQNYSRKHLVPVNSLKFKTVVLSQTLDTINGPPEDGVYLYGMFFDGADWDKEKMCLKDPMVGTSFASAPVIHLIPCQNYVPPEEDFICPVYRTQIRAGILASTGLSTNFVVSVHLPVKEPP